MALAGLLAFSATLPAQYDDFDSGTDTGWLKSTAHPKTITFPPDALGGYAYRLQGTPMTSGSDTNSRVYCYMANRLYTNFYAAVDVVAWNTNQDCEQVLGIIARASSNEYTFNYSFDPDAPCGLVYNVLSHNYRTYTGPTNYGPLGASDQMSIWGIVNAFGTASLGNPVAVVNGNPPSAAFRWLPGHAYRLVYSSTNSSADAQQWYTASIYDVNDLTQPLFTMTGDNSYPGNDQYIPPFGYVGIFTYKIENGDFDSTVDVTFDNFYVGETAPVTSVLPPAIPHGKRGAPQVVNRVPASFKNFHPAASGIAFNATTLTTTNTINTDAIKLYLNGVDVSAALIISGPATNASVSYYGLATNVVYDARIVLQDALGRRTTNEWTFDTFSDAYLASPAVKVIEAEDCDFTDYVSDGLFIDDPPASGLYDYDPVTDSGTQVNYASGYTDQPGSNAKHGGLDYFDYDSSPQTFQAQYRHVDSFGTQQGNFACWIGANNTAYDYSRAYETQRSKYSSVNPTLHEYILMRTEGGEWLNYTRVFDGSKRYNAYLRAACGLAQPVRLDQIATGPVTNTLGRFTVPSTGYQQNYRYIPLVTADDSLAVVHLSGTNTLRLTMDSPQNNGTKFGLSLNYVVLVPAAPQLYSSETVNGTYTPESSVLLDAGNKKFTVPRAGASRFYRIGWTSQVKIIGTALVGGNVVLSYQ